MKSDIHIQKHTLVSHSHNRLHEFVMRKDSTRSKVELNPCNEREQSVVLYQNKCAVLYLLHRCFSVM